MTNEELKEEVVTLVNKVGTAMDLIRDAMADFGGAIDKAERDGYVGTMFRTRYSVTGYGEFPVDMLRYTVSWPNDEQDARAIEQSLEQGNHNDPFTIRLCKYHRDASPNLSEERWQSKFRWKVLHTDSDATRIETTRI